MSRHTSHTPNISAIEDRALEQAERAAAIREEVFAESRERELWLSDARTVTGKPNGRPVTVRRSYADILADVTGSIPTGREPCFACGVRADVHDEFGCGRRKVR